MKNPWNVMKEKIDSSSTSMQDGDWRSMESLLNDSNLKPTGMARWKIILMSLSALFILSLGVYMILPSDQVIPTSKPQNISSDSKTSDVIKKDEPTDSSPISNTDNSNELTRTNGEARSSISTSTQSTPSKSSSNENSNVDDQGQEEIGSTLTASRSNTLDPNDQTDLPESGQEGSSTSDEDISIPSPETKISGDAPSELSNALNAGDPHQGESMQTIPGIGSSSSEEPEYTMEEERPETPATAMDDEDPAETAMAEEAQAIDRESDEVEEDEITNEEETPSVIRRPSDELKDFWVEANIGYTPAINTSLNTFQGGFEFGYRKNGWTLQTGINVANTSGDIYTNYTEPVTVYDTTSSTRVDTSSRINVTRTWVITGWYMGEFVYDTTIVTEYDTVTVTQVDTAIENQLRTMRSEIRSTYYQIPVLAGYEWTNDQWSYGVQGGINFRSVTYTHPELNPASGYGLDALIRPYIGYSWNDSWTVFLRSNVSIPLSNDPILNRSNFTRIGGSIGVGYRF